MFATLLGAREGLFDDAADSERGVDADLGGDLVRSADADRAPVTGVGTLRALADHHEIDVRVTGKWAADSRVEPARAQVDVVIELESQP